MYNVALENVLMFYVEKIRELIEDKINNNKYQIAYQKFIMKNKVHKDDRSSALKNNLNSNPPPHRYIFTPATIRNDFLIKF